jgi:hypothetical protein
MPVMKIANSEKAIVVLDHVMHVEYRTVKIIITLVTTSR